ncbi:MAG: DUF1997 domain-containing protein [Cyanobacteriota bacterium]
MTLAFSARQTLCLNAAGDGERLADYLADEERVIGALLNLQQLEPLAPGHYRYTVTRLQVFQLQIQPIVDLRARLSSGRIDLEATDCRLEGLGMVDHFQLSLESWLVASDDGLEGEATLSVQVSQPPLLRMIPARVLEATGRSLLGGILLGIRTRVSQQLLGDYRRWCDEQAR